MRRGFIHLAVGLAIVVASSATEVSAQEYRGSVVSGQSRPDGGGVVYPYDLYGAGWNYRTPQAARQGAMEACKNGGARICGRGYPEYTFSTDADAPAHRDGNYIAARCTIVVIAPNPALSGPHQVYAYRCRQRTLAGFPTRTVRPA